MTAEQARDPTAEYLIWWVDPSKIDATPGVPAYIRNELRSMHGRNPRGRLWVADGIPVTEMTNPERAPLGRGGIVIRSGDARFLRQLPGFITTLAGERIPTP